MSVFEQTWKKSLTAKKSDFQVLETNLWQTKLVTNKTGDEQVTMFVLRSFLLLFSQWWDFKICVFLVSILFFHLGFVTSCCKRYFVATTRLIIKTIERSDDGIARSDVPVCMAAMFSPSENQNSVKSINPAFLWSWPFLKPWMLEARHGTTPTFWKIDLRANRGLIKNIWA